MEEKSTERRVFEVPGAWFAGPLWSVQSTSRICLLGWTLGALIDLLPTPWVRLPIRVLTPCISGMQNFEGWVDPLQSRSQGRKRRAELLVLQVCEPCHPLPHSHPVTTPSPGCSRNQRGTGDAEPLTAVGPTGPVPPCFFHYCLTVCLFQQTFFEHHCTLSFRFQDTESSKSVSYHLPFQWKAVWRREHNILDIL